MYPESPAGHETFDSDDMHRRVGVCVSPGVVGVRAASTSPAQTRHDWLRNQTGSPAVTARQPVVGCVGVEPFGSSRSKPSGVYSLPAPVPCLPVMPYCHTSALVTGSKATMR